MAWKEWRGSILKIIQRLILSTFQAFAILYFFCHLQIVLPSQFFSFSRTLYKWMRSHPYGCGCAQRSMWNVVACGRTYYTFCVRCRAYLKGVCAWQPPQQFFLVSPSTVLGICGFHYILSQIESINFLQFQDKEFSLAYN